MMVIRLIAESFGFALSSLKENKLRTFLSLIGITIGIMTIIGVFSAVDTFRAKIQTSIDKLGSNTIYIEKWPWQFGGDYAWWKYMNRPQVSFREYQKLKERGTNIEAFSFFVGLDSKTLKYGSNSVEGAQVSAVTHDFYKTWDFEIDNGRYFSDAESNNGSPVVLIGNSIAEGLFPHGNAIGKTIMVMGRKLNIIGVFKGEGDDMLGMSVDKWAVIPLNYAKSLVNINENGPQVLAKGKEGMPMEEVESELRGLMRSIRRLSPTVEDNFALNKTTILTAGMDGLFSIINAAGGGIGIFSILVGGFGIANIMFVSVKERTNIIGIQKSLGAKNYFILFQFLFEAVLLCLMGGAVGLGVVYLISMLLQFFADFTVVVDGGKVVLMFVLSTVIGLISGIIPAFVASRLNPVEAIRSK